MYPEEGGADTGGADAFPSGGSGFKSKITSNLEGLIPLILILIIVAFLGHKFGFWEIPYLGSEQPMELLVIGENSRALDDVLNSSKDLVRVHNMDPQILKVNPKEQLAQFDIVLLNQTTSESKTVSRQLGQAIEEWVKRGGKLIVVMDSGIRRDAALDVLGWEATFNGVVPVKCENTEAPLIPGCTDPRNIAGVIIREDWDHPIMKGIQRVPAEGIMPLTMTVFPVTQTGKQIAFIEDVSTGDLYPGIVEKELLIGKSIYFNYDPGYTKGVMQATLRYLR